MKKKAIFLAAVVALIAACGLLASKCSSSSPEASVTFEEIPEEWALRSIRGDNGELIDKDTGEVLARVDEETGKLVTEPGVVIPAELKALDKKTSPETTTSDKIAFVDSGKKTTLAGKKTTPTSSKKTTTTTRTTAGTKTTTKTRSSTTSSSSNPQTNSSTTSTTNPTTTQQPTTTLPDPVAFQPDYEEGRDLVEPDGDLPTSSFCANQVTNRGETVPENIVFNKYWGTSISGTYLGTLNSHINYEARVKGDYSGTTDQILQWGACKWGLKLEYVRALAYAESKWWSGKVSGSRVGIMQVNTNSHYGLGNAIGTHTALNVDYALAVIRACHEGDEPSWDSRWGQYNCYGRWHHGVYDGGNYHTSSQFDYLYDEDAAFPSTHYYLRANIDLSGFRTFGP